MQLDVVVKDMMEDLEDSEQAVLAARAPRFRAIFLDECRQRPWSQTAVDCFSAARYLADYQECVQLVPWMDRVEMQARLDALRP